MSLAGMGSEPQYFNDRRTVRLAVSTALAAQIAAHLQRCDQYFRPPLSTRLDLAEYARKLHQSAITFEGWCADDLIGLVAAYLNDPAGEAGYVTNVSVDKPFQGGGLAFTLMRQCLARASELRFKRLTLEVAEENEKAVTLYRRLGFEAINKTPGLLKMAVVLEGTGRSD